MKRALLAGTFLALSALSGTANADEILNFNQTSSVRDATLVATGGTSTTISVSSIPVSITELFGGAPESAIFSMNASSVGAAVNLGGGAFLQHFNGSFSILAGAINVLSGVFTDLALGVNAALGIQSSDPPDSITFTSDVIPASEFGQPRGVSFELTDFTPGAHLDGTTLASGSGSIGGSFSSNPIPEPITLAVLGTGMAGLGFIRRQRRTV